MIPDGGMFYLIEMPRLHGRPRAHYRICGKLIDVWITDTDVIAITNAGHRLYALGLNEQGRSFLYGPP